tara:strand:+ start:660 stop:941 length:282 start_codon:yes stop_codon:yes gene_type:complete
VSEIQKSSNPAKEYGESLSQDIFYLAFEACMDRFGYDISALTKEEQDRIQVAVLDAWTDWPADSDAAWNAAIHTLRSMAVAGGWEEFILHDGH